MALPFQGSSKTLLANWSAKDRLARPVAKLPQVPDLPLSRRGKPPSAPARERRLNPDTAGGRRIGAYSSGYLSTVLTRLPKASLSPSLVCVEAMTAYIHVDILYRNKPERR